MKFDFRHLPSGEAATQPFWEPVEGKSISFNFKLKLKKKMKPGATDNLELRLYGTREMAKLGKQNLGAICYSECLVPWSTIQSAGSDTINLEERLHPI